ncbi:MAG: orotate phosphoribosyltransferase [Armatimonadota bacterium]|nr:orotate phosphoribosyltransferase [Armatimonadota bacterium]MDR7404812.1 orotate phosphoribosyltransferase [Armatimonadota bacterium]MDR7516015.1 orotate phosphoribosyltransferase [Armatimonadota bacterium]MDR7588741.1 orotate phosphoribosyltransferase [Armatimonadota bacterium]MDR7612019.1 orotate phosphoribosyltransferase [Armatimonadota bacterium]
MRADDVIALLRQTGAFQTGHFLLSSGMHSPQYIQCALLLQYPEHAARVGAALADRFRASRPQAVIGPAYGGMIIAHEVARALGARSLFAERVEGKFELRRSFAIAPGERVLVVEDVVTTGAATREVARLVERLGGVVVGVGAIVDRSAGPLRFDCPVEALAAIEAPAYIPSLCDLCREGVPLVKPGSRSWPAAVG